MALYLGLDVGTQGVKAVVYDAPSRRIVARGAYPLSLLPTVIPGRAEQHPQSWIDGVRSAARQALAGVDATRVKAVGVSGQQHGCGRGQVVTAAELTDCYLRDRLLTRTVDAAARGQVDRLRPARALHACQSCRMLPRPISTSHASCATSPGRLVVLGEGGEVLRASKLWWAAAELVSSPRSSPLARFECPCCPQGRPAASAGARGSRLPCRMGATAHSPPINRDAPSSAYTSRVRALC
jgi:hypothetical protein